MVNISIILISATRDILDFVRLHYFLLHNYNPVVEHAYKEHQMIRKKFTLEGFAVIHKYILNNAYYSAFRN